MSAIVISAFPGTGKSWCYNNPGTLKILDSDSSKFDKSNFPQNYIEHIKSNMDKADVIFVSSHKVVRDALVDNGIPFVLVFPHIYERRTYLNRYKERGSSKEFIDLVSKNWILWNRQCESQSGCKKVCLINDQYLSDVLPTILKRMKMMNK